MAAIDKCYVDSWEDYQEFIKWARGKEYTTPRGCRVRISDYIITWDKENFTDDGDSCERPIFNSPTHMDNYLYHNCPLEFIKDWLEDRYCDEGYRKGDAIDIECELGIPEYTPCTKVKVAKKGMGNMPYMWHRSGVCHKVGGWHIDVRPADGSWKSYWYNEDIDQWIFPGEEDVWTCSAAHSTKSVKSIIRKIIRKWKLPVGCKVTVSGRFVGDEWILITK